MRWQTWTLLVVLVLLIGGVITQQTGFTQKLTRDFSKAYPDDYRLLERWFGPFDTGRSGPRFDHLPLMQLHFSNQDVAKYELLGDRYYDAARGHGYFERTGAWHEDQNYGLPYYRKHNKWRKAELTYGDRRYQIRFKAHGRTPYNHRVGKMISMSIKVVDGQIHNASRFNLIVARRRRASYDATARDADALGLLRQHDREVAVRINNNATYRFYLEHRLDDKHMEADGKASLVRFRSPTEKFTSRSLVGPFAGEVVTPLLGERLAREDIVGPAREALLEHYVAFNHAIKASDHEAIEAFVDVAYIARLEAYRRVKGFTGHGFLGENLYVFLDTTNGHFYPAVTRDNFPGRVAPVVGYEAFVNVATWGAPNTQAAPLTMFATFTRNDRIRAAAYREAWKLLANEETASAAALRKYLQEVDASVSWQLRGDDLEIDIRPGAMQPLRVGALELASPPTADLAIDVREGDRTLLSRVVPTAELSDVLQTVTMFDGLDDELGRVARTYRIRISGGRHELASLQLESELTGEPVPSTLTASTLAAWPETQALPAKPTGRRFEAGEHLIENDVVIDGDLVIDPGATLRLGAGVSLVVRGNLHAEGTADSPIVIEPLTGAPYGTFAVAGGGRATTTLKHVRVSGGSERWIAGAFFSAGLSIHDNKSVHIAHCTFRGHAADDGLNVKRSRVHIEHSTFVDSAADQVDLDVCEGTVAHSHFEVSEANPDGDGLDVSFSQLVVHDSSFAGFGDKGMSVGEKSDVVLSNTRHERNHYGIAVKDQSIAVLRGVKMVGNHSDVAAYRKKQHFGGALVFGVDVSFTREIDERSIASAELELEGATPQELLVSMRERRLAQWPAGLLR